ncbi:hypothetical protein Tco_1425522 [Tanacetum coccineum]
MDVTIEQWLDLMYGDHKIFDRKIKEEVISKWLIQSYKKQFNEYMEIKKHRMTHGVAADMEYDPSDVDFTEWIALKFSNHLTMDWYTKNALWMYWIRGDDVEVLTDKELSNLKETYVNEEDEIAKIFRIKTYIFDFETPMCKSFNEFNYLPKINTDLLTHDIPGFKIYKEYKNGFEDGELKNEALMKKTEFKESRDPCSFDVEWEDFEHANHIGANANYNPYLDISRIFNSRAGKSNEEATKDERKPIDDYGVGDSDDHLISNNAPDYANKEEEQYKKRGCDILRNPHEIPPTCKIERFEVIKYSFGPVEEFVAIKEYGYNDWMKTEEDACHVYRDIFAKIDEGWFVTRVE